MDLPGLHHQGIGLADPVYESDGLAKCLGNDPYDRSHRSRGLRSDPHDRNGPSRSLWSDPYGRSGLSRGVRSDPYDHSGPFRCLGSDFDARRRYLGGKSMIIKGIILYL
jgi:hypothetical protein